MVCACMQNSDGLMILFRCWLEVPLSALIAPDAMDRLNLLLLLVRDGGERQGLYVVFVVREGGGVGGRGGREREIERER